MGDDAEERLIANERTALPTFEESKSSLYALYHRHVANERPYFKHAFIVLHKIRPNTRSLKRAIQSSLMHSIAGIYDHAEIAVMMERTHGSPDDTWAWTVDFADPRKPGSGKVRSYVGSRASMYPTERWEYYSISSLSPQEIYGLVAYLNNQIGKEMDGRGLYMNMPVLRWFIGEPNVEEEKYFCSQLMCSALRWIRPEQYAHINPRRCTPMGLYTMLQDRGEFREQVSFRPPPPPDDRY